MKSELEFRNALQNKKVPLLVLDQKWHRLFAVHGKSQAIKECEAELNSHIARQGQCNSEIKEMKNAKAQLMNGIVQNMETGYSQEHDSRRDRKLEESKRLIDELNEKMEALEDELMELPKIIHDTNERLMILSMEYFYDKIRENKKEADEIGEWINAIRIELKENIIKKQNCEINNKEIYSYLHDIFGFEVLDVFDIHYEEQMEEGKEGGEN